MKESKWKDKENCLGFKEMMQNRNQNQKILFQTMVVMIAVIIMKKCQKLTKKVNLLKSNKKFWKIAIKAMNQVYNNKKVNKKWMMIHLKMICFDWKNLYPFKIV